MSATSGVAAMLKPAARLQCLPKCLHGVACAPALVLAPRHLSLLTGISMHVTLRCVTHVSKIMPRPVMREKRVEARRDCAQQSYSCINANQCTSVLATLLSTFSTVALVMNAQICHLAQARGWAPDAAAHAEIQGQCWWAEQQD